MYVGVYFMSVKFSVITPVYNAAEYINETLFNLSAFDGAPFEIIFIDDGSTDGSADIIADYCRTRANACLIKSPHKGVSAARNQGIAAARGEYILFLDADDSFAEDIFAVLGVHIAQTRPDILVFGAKVINHSADYVLEDISPRNVIYKGFHPDILFSEKGARPYVWNCAYRTEFLRQNSIAFDEEISLGEDNLFQFTAYPLAKVTQFISDKLYCYNYLRFNSAMSRYLSDSVLHCRNHLLLLDKIISVLKKNTNFSAIKDEFSVWEYQFLRNDFYVIKGNKLNELSCELKAIHKKHGITIKKLKDKKTMIKLYAFMHPCIQKIIKTMRGVK